MSEIILTGCKTQIIIIIKTIAAQLKVHINTTTVTKYDNNKYDKPEKLWQMKKKKYEQQL